MTIEPITPPGTPSKSYQWRDPVPLAGVTIICIWLEVAGHAAFGGAMTAQLAGALPGNTGEMIVGLTALVQIALFLLAGFMSLKWVYRVQMNAHTLAGALASTPPWAVGWFFVPIMNLYKPFEALKQAWRVARSPQGWAQVQLPGVINWWWGLWLTSNIVGNISGRMDTLNGPLAVKASTRDVVGITAEVLAVVAGLLFIQVVRQLSEDQRHTLQGDTFG